MAALCTLVQFPVAETIYIFLVAPLGFLALLAVFSLQRDVARPVLAVITLFYIAFSVVWINRSIHIAEDYPPFMPDNHTYALQVDRGGGIRVGENEGTAYDALVPLLRELTDDEYIFATPDCPEVYFLGGFKNPTRTTYDFFDEPEGRTERIKAILTEKDIRVVVLSRVPQFSPLPAPDLVQYLRAQYPMSRQIAIFEVRWKR